jgi:hypothetical protein
VEVVHDHEHELEVDARPEDRRLWAAFGMRYNNAISTCRVREDRVERDLAAEGPLVDII